MSQAGPQHYFRQLVYYVISLIATMNSLCFDKQFEQYRQASEIAQNISDELYVLHDLMHCQVHAVEQCIRNTLLRSLLHHFCFPAVFNAVKQNAPQPTNVSLLSPFHLV